MTKFALTKNYFIILFSILLFYYFLQQQNTNKQKKEGGFMSESSWEKDHIFLELVLLNVKQQMTRVSSKERTNL